MPGIRARLGGETLDAASGAAELRRNRRSHHLEFAQSLNPRGVLIERRT
jgi:hypothetical protein